MNPVGSPRPTNARRGSRSETLGRAHSARPSRVTHQPKPAPTPTDFSSPLNAPPIVSVARSLSARW